MSLRRVPTQERSKRRLEAILEAAGEIFADIGFDAATMEGIAERAGTSIGSVYQFFPNKLSIFRALSDRCLTRSAETFATILASAADKGVLQLVDEVIDGFADLHESDPAMQALWLNFQLYGEYAEADEAMIEGFVETAAELMSQKAPEIPPRKRKLVASMVVQAITALLFSSRHADEKTARALRTETKKMVKSYLSTYLRGA